MNMLFDLLSYTLSSCALIIKYEWWIQFWAGFYNCELTESRAWNILMIQLIVFVSWFSLAVHCSGHVPCLHGSVVTWVWECGAGAGVSPGPAPTSPEPEPPSHWSESTRTGLWLVGVLEATWWLKCPHSTGDNVAMTPQWSPQQAGLRSHGDVMVIVCQCHNTNISWRPRTDAGTSETTSGEEEGETSRSDGEQEEEGGISSVSWRETT